MNNLPIAVETQEHIFVHAGLENRPDWENTDNNYAITVPWFLNKGSKQIWDFLSAFPSSAKNELVYYIESSDGYARIIKESGEVGWIPEKYLERSSD